jgi:Secretion system C-terminal sorting domain
MKYISSLIFTFIFGLNAFAQTDFMPVGARLQTKAIAYGFSGTAIFNSQKDTICGGTPCRKVVITHEDKVRAKTYTDSIFFQQRGDSIFEYSTYLKKSSFLFKNNYSAGDSFLIQQTFGNVVLPYAVVFVDTVTTFSGIKRYECRMKCREINATTPAFTTPFVMYDRFIPEYNWNIYVICQLGFYDGFRYTLQCYSDNATSYKSRDYTGNCDFINLSTGINDYRNDVKIFPNPADNFITIESTKAQLIIVTMKNINGVEVLNKTILTPINLSSKDLPNGVYSVSVQDNKGYLTLKKIVIQH